MATTLTSRAISARPPDAIPSKLSQSNDHTTAAVCSARRHSQKPDAICPGPWPSPTADGDPDAVLMILGL